MHSCTPHPASCHAPQRHHDQHHVRARQEHRSRGGWRARRSAPWWPCARSRPCRRAGSARPGRCAAAPPRRPPRRRTSRRPCTTPTRGCPPGPTAQLPQTYMQVLHISMTQEHTASPSRHHDLAGSRVSLQNQRDLVDMRRRPEDTQECGPPSKNFQKGCSLAIITTTISNTVCVHLM